MRKRVEFIEEYIRVGDDWSSPYSDGYKWNDNHGILVRCKDCKWGRPYDGGLYTVRCDYPFPTVEQSIPVEEEHFCSYGERKKA